MKLLEKKCRLFLLLLLCLCAAGARPAQAAPEGLIAKALANEDPKGVLKTTSKGISFKHSDGSAAQKEWLSYKDTVYCFGSDGYAKTGWFSWNGSRYYATGKGAVQYSKWITTGKNKFYVRKDGTKAVSLWLYKGGKYYYFNKTGILQVSKQLHLGGKYYYVNKKGQRLINTWVTRSGKRYFFGKEGVRYQSVWLRYKNKFYFLKSNGVMAKDRWIGSYYVGSDGARLTNTSVDGWELGADGKKTGKRIKSMILVGDSRTVGMSQSVTAKNTTFIGAVSMGYNWLTTTGVTKLKKSLEKNPRTTVVMWLGINDLGNADKYIAYYRKLQSSYPKTAFYVMAVAPVNESKGRANGYTVTNSQIQAMNSKFKSAFGSKYVDAYTYLKKNGFGTADGIHYDGATYRKLYNWLAGKFL